MHPDAATLWRGPRWTLAVLLACLGMLGPFAIDTYLPAFDGIARTLAATPLQMQQTLSAYLFGFAAMNLFHGALADAYVRMGARPTFTCAPYQLDGAPGAGEAIAWAESNAVVYANSVLGARTNFEGGPSALAAALTGFRGTLICAAASGRRRR